jgi:rod shape determining protein RodA
LNLIQEMDLTILLPALLLAGIGVAMVYSATFLKADLARLYLKQILMIGVGVGCLLFFASFNYQVLVERFAYPVYGFLVVVLAVLLAAGNEIAGSKRWLSLGPFGLQPSEFAKVATTLVVARFLNLRQNRLGEWTTILGAFLLAGIPMLLILKEPDLGTALVFMPMVVAMLYIVGVPIKRMLWLAGTLALTSPMVWFVLKDYQRKRIMVFLNPAYDTLGAGYNVLQSMIAIGSGGPHGKGWLSGTQGQLRFVPEHHTDFIFSVTAEEWGFTGSMVLLVLFSLLLLQMLRVARSARDMEGSLIAVGLTTIMFTQVAVNIGVATGIIPVTGMTLPFISYGGSSMIVCLSMIGIIMSIWTGRKVK